MVLANQPPVVSSLQNILNARRQDDNTNNVVLSLGSRLDDIKTSTEMNVKTGNQLHRDLLSIRKLLGDNKKDAPPKTQPMSTPRTVKDFNKNQNDIKQLRTFTDMKDILLGIYNKKDETKKEGLFDGLMKFLPLLGGAGILGGTLAALLTGKSEFFTDGLKGLKLMFGNLGKSIATLVGKGLQTAFRMATTSVGDLLKIPKFFGEIGHIATNIGGAISRVGKAFQFGGLTGAGKAVGRMFGKAVGTGALKKIPVLGTLVGIGFGINRFRKGQIVEGLGEIASGATSLLGPLGLPLGLVIDGLLLASDLKRQGNEGDPESGTGSTGGFFSGKSTTGGIANTSGNTGDAMGIARQILDTRPKAMSFSPSNLSRTTVTKQKPKSSGSTGGGVGVSKATNKASVGGLGKLSYGDYVRLKDKSAHMEGVNPSVLANFSRMAKEYYETTGNKLVVNSGYRTQAEQAKLNKSVKNSAHMMGAALDVHGPQVTQLKSMGLLSKYGFHRPLWSPENPYYKKSNKQEDWHIEPFALMDNKLSENSWFERMKRIRGGLANFDMNEGMIDYSQNVGSTGSDSGDAPVPMSFHVRPSSPSAPVDTGVNVAKQGILNVRLDPSDLRSLASMIGDQFKQSLPREKVVNTNSTGIPAFSRG